MNKYLTFLGLSLLISACANGHNLSQKFNDESLQISGWVSVNPDMHKADLKSKDISFAKSFDEFVGGLMDDGLSIRESRWYKPTYGNQNLLFTNNRKIGDRTAESWLKSQKAFSAKYYKFYHSQLSVDNIHWRYTGYRDTSSGKGSRAYNAFVFVCGEKLAGVSVFYWGDGSAIAPFENDSVVELLTKLSRACK